MEDVLKQLPMLKQQVIEETKANEHKHNEQVAKFKNELSEVMDAAEHARDLVRKTFSKDNAFMEGMQFGEHQGRLMEKHKHQNEQYHAGVLAKPVRIPGLDGNSYL